MIKIGTIVKSVSGRDKGSFYAVVGYDEEANAPLIADGRRRKIENPKRKNPRHISVTNTIIEQGILNGITNKKLRNFLHEFNFPLNRERNFNTGE
ncbi:MAG: KOW domain-containing RNA-binding protein [Oscillospiraceae bacterium]|nr:KOW domain-containing RNA-binding protein [Oscillospiraceae bacterium]